MKLKDLAEHLNLSVTTVSRGLSGYGEVSLKTRERILRAAGEMNYVPNTQALNLKKGRTNLIGLVLSHDPTGFEDLYLQSLALSISSELSKRDYSLIMAGSSSTEKEMNALQRLVQGKSVDGVILIRTRVQDEKVKFLIQSGFPFVCHGKTGENQPYCYVESDGEKGHKLATGRLIRFGHRRIAWLGGEPGYFSSGSRLAGYRAAMSMYDVPVDPDLIKFGKISKLRGREAVRELTALPDPPSAYVCSSDILALGVIEEFKSMGVGVGKEVSVIGYDDYPIAEWMDPPLTSVNSNFRLMAEKLVEFLIRRIGGAPAEELQVVTDVSISSRQSDGPFQRR